MGALTSLGKASKTVFLASEGNKLSQEFTVASANTVKAGQPVKLNAAGEVLPWAKADGVHTNIGIAMTNQAAGELVTVWCRGYMIVFGLSLGALDAGPVTQNSYDTSTVVGENTGYNKYEALGTGGTDTTQQVGWNLDQAGGANALIRVMIRN